MVCWLGSPKGRRCMLGMPHLGMPERAPTHLVIEALQADALGAGADAGGLAECACTCARLPGHQNSIYFVCCSAAAQGAVFQHPPFSAHHRLAAPQDDGGPKTRVAANSAAPASAYCRSRLPAPLGGHHERFEHMCDSKPCQQSLKALLIPRVIIQQVENESESLGVASGELGQHGGPAGRAAGRA